MIGRRTRGELIGEGKGLLLRHDGRLTAALRRWGREQNLERNGGSKRNKTMSAKSEVGSSTCPARNVEEFPSGEAGPMYVCGYVCNPYGLVRKEFINWLDCPHTGPCTLPAMLQIQVQVTSEPSPSAAKPRGQTISDFKVVELLIA